MVVGTNKIHGLDLVYCGMHYGYVKGKHVQGKWDVPVTQWLHCTTRRAGRAIAKNSLRGWNLYLECLQSSQTEQWEQISLWGEYTAQLYFLVIGIADTKLSWQRLQSGRDGTCSMSCLLGSILDSYIIYGTMVRHHHWSYGWVYPKSIHDIPNASTYFQYQSSSADFVIMHTTDFLFIFVDEHTAPSSFPKQKTLYLTPIDQVLPWLVYICLSTSGCHYYLRSRNLFVMVCLSFPALSFHCVTYSG